MPATKPSLADLHEALASRSARKRIDALLQLQNRPPTGAILDTLRVALSDTNPRVRDTAAVVTHLLGPAKRKLPEARALRDALLAATEDATREVARQAARAAASVGGATPDVLARARAALQSVRADERAIGVCLLAEAERLPADLAPLLIATLERDPEEAELALVALGAVRGAWETVLPVLAKRLGDPRLHASATEAIGRLDAPAAEKKRLLAPRFADPAQAIDAVHAMLDARAGAGDILRAIEGLARGNEKARRAYVDALFRIGERRQDPEPITRLERMLDDRSRKVATDAADRLAWLWPRRPAAREALRRAELHARPEVRDLARRHRGNYASARRPSRTR